MKIVSLLFLALFSFQQGDAFFGKQNACESPCVPGDESIMSQKEHGTSDTPVQSDLRWNCDHDTADRICNYNRHWAEQGGYWETTSFLSETLEEQASEEPVIFYDSNTGKKLFTAPVGRLWKEFVKESKAHGWPSFRDGEVNWDLVRVLKNGETVSVDGTHLGHNLPDAKGNRYCINLVSVAGNAVVKNTRASGQPYRDQEEEDMEDYL